MIWILILVLFAGSAQADVTRKHKTQSQFMGSSEGTSSEYYTADKQTRESTMKWTSGMMKTMSGGKELQSADIVRLDKELIWHVDPKDKSYTQMTFAEFKEMMDKSAKEMQKMQGQEKPDSTTEDMYEWKVEDKSEAAAKTINTYSCRNVNIVATGVNKKDSLDKVVITLNTWNSEAVPGAQEIRAFQERYLKAIGLDMKALTPGLMQAGMFFKKQFETLIEAGKKAPGEPVQSLMEMKRYQLKGVAVGDAMKEGMQNELMGKLPFGKKKSPPKEQKPEWEWQTKFSVQNELLEAASGGVDATKFDVPAGFKLKKK